MFPHAVTVVNAIETKEGIEYHSFIIKDVFYHTEKVISQEDKGDKFVTSHRTIFSNDALKNFKIFEEYKNLEDKSNSFTLRENDIVVFGKCENIKALIDLQKSAKEYFLIRSISDNRYGSIELQNIEVTD